ncbi:nuclear pore complex assembly-domain-containing protein [Tuber indicum]|nr:nuclear pore complex assembly-domain-containing protein [Tuber indicum]
MDLDRSSLAIYRSIFPDDRKFPYTRDRIGQIMRHRSSLDGCLFFDYVLREIARIEDVDRLYPPKNVVALRTLVTVIMEKEELDKLKRDSFIYYLKKDFDHAHPDNDDAGSYAQKSLVQPNFCSLMDGLWALDNFRFEEAIMRLAEPAVTPINPHKILSTLIRHAGPTLGPRLATTFVQATQTKLNTDDSIRDYFTALNATSIESAFLYQRTVPESLQHELFTSLIDHCLTVRKEANSLKLIGLPFTPREQQMFEDHIRHSNLPAAQDTLIIKHLHQGQLDDALAAAKSARYQNEPELGGLNWANLARGLSLGIGPRVTNEETV